MANLITLLAISLSLTALAEQKKYKEPDLRAKYEHLQTGFEDTPEVYETDIWERCVLVFKDHDMCDELVKLND